MRRAVTAGEKGRGQIAIANSAELFQAGAEDRGDARGPGADHHRVEAAKEFHSRFGYALDIRLQGGVAGLISCPIFGRQLLDCLCQPLGAAAAEEYGCPLADHCGGAGKSQSASTTIDERPFALKS